METFSFEDALKANEGSTVEDLQSGDATMFSPDEEQAIQAEDALDQPLIDKGNAQWEQNFQRWYGGYAKMHGLNPNPDDPRHHYDYRAAFGANAKPDKQGHWPSQFKTEGHPNLVVGGVNTKTGQPVGRGAPAKASFSFEEATKAGNMGKEVTGAAFGEFLPHAWDTVKKTGSALANKPWEIPFGVVESAAGVVSHLGITAGAGGRGVFEGVKDLVTGKEFFPGFNRGLQSVLGPASQLPLEDETEVGKALTGLLALLPEAFHVAGETVFEKTGSALAGSGTEGLLTLLSFKPAAATKTLKWAFPNRGEMKGKKPGAASVQTAFDELAQTDPAKARDIARHVASEDLGLAAELNAKVTEAAKKPRIKLKSSPSQIKQVDPLDLAFERAKSAIEIQAPETEVIGPREPTLNAEPWKRVNEQATTETRPFQEPRVTDPRAEPTLRSVPPLREVTEPGPPRGVDLGEEIRKLEKHLEQQRAAPPEKDPFTGMGKSQAGAVKLPGGMWHPETVKRLAEPLITGLGGRRGNLNDILHDTPQGTWAVDRISKYLNKYAGTERDPLKDIRIPMAGETARWEDITDQLISSDLAKNFDRDKATGAARPDEPVWSASDPYNTRRDQTRPLATFQDYLTHVGDYLREFVPRNQLQRYDLVRAVRETALQDLKQAKKMEKAQASGEGTTLYKEYPDGMKWVEVVEEQALRNEGDIMGHCVGGYCEAVHNGDSKIYSLRDKKGMSHVTVEIQPPGRYGGGAAPFVETTSPDIVQIKGKQNRAPVEQYRPYVQDFINSGQWGDVGDLQNAGLVKGENVAGQTIKPGISIRHSQLRQVGMDPGKYYTPEDLKAFARKAQAEGERSQSMQALVAAQQNLHNTARAAVTVLDQAGKITAPVTGRPRTAMEEAFNKAAGDSIVYMHAGIPVTKADVIRAFQLGRKVLQKMPVYNKIERELTTSVDQVIRNIVPEALGPQAKGAAAVVAKAIATRMQQDSVFTHRAEERHNFWQSKDAELQMEFLEGLEQGGHFPDPLMNTAREGYKNWANDIHERDTKLGIKYSPHENYLYHLFEDPKGVSDYFDSATKRWGDPLYIRDRSLGLYQRAIVAGFRPKVTNPEDIMLARQHASDVAAMEVGALREMEQYGLARKAVKGERPLSDDRSWTTPSGETFWMHENAHQILKNAFNTKSLWNMQGLGGSAFRGTMWMKNATVPVLLALSLFHPIHVQSIHNATAMVRATKELWSGESSPAAWMKEMSKAAVYSDFFSSPMAGGRIRRAYTGKIKDADLTEADKLALQYMADGGFVPEMSVQYKNNAVTKFGDALRSNSAAAAFHLPFAAIEAMQKPMFEVWIPNLKIASYLKDVDTALKTDPSLLNDPLKRQLAFRALAKSVDNRYGEMAYSTLFWNRMIKDVGVASTLSLGWTLGFLREYGGAGIDIGKQLVGQSSLKESVAAGKLDRPMFVAYYTAQALLYGGLLTWYLTGKPPEELKDYIYPQTGEVNKDGSPSRVNTMFYTREFMAMSKRIENEGALKGALHFLGSKISPALTIMKDWADNVDFFGREISDPDAPEYKQVAQKLSYALKELEPISIQSVLQGDKTPKSIALGIAGFSPAPKYATDTSIETNIKHLFSEYHAKKTPYERAQYSEKARELRKALENRDEEGYRSTLKEMTEKYGLTGKDIAQLRKSTGESDPTVKMFKVLTNDQQVKLLLKMTPAEVQVYLPAAHEKSKRIFFNKRGGH